MSNKQEATYGPTPDPERVTAYAMAIDNLTNPPITTLDQQWLDDVAAAVMAVADAEQAELRAENERLDAQLHDDDGWISRASDAEAENERLRRNTAGLYARAHAAEAKVRAVEALVDELAEHVEGAAGFDYGDARDALDDLRAALADVPAEVKPEDDAAHVWRATPDVNWLRIQVRERWPALARALNDWQAPAEVTPPAEPCPYETRYALHSNGMKCCDEDGA